VGKTPNRTGRNVLIKSWKERAPANQHQPKWKGPYPVILAIPMVVKVQGIHFSRVKYATEDSTSNQTQPGDTYSCEPIEDLKLIFQRN
jgi:hypothetical protein